MRQAIAIVLGMLLPLLGLSELGEAQAPQSIKVAGTIVRVNCHDLTVALDTGGGPAVYRAAGAATFYANGAGIALCDLQRYMGAPASVWLTALGNDLLITRLDVGGPSAPTAQPTPQPAPVPYTQPAPSAPAPNVQPGLPADPYTYPSSPPYYGNPYYGYPGYSIAGVVLGTIIVAGLVYLLVRGAGGYLYRYPYYGPYYRYYYRPYYRPYFGPYRYAPAYRWCPGYRGGYWCR
jgi:hypothetical protein